jgi:hypothetical protein
MFDLSSMAVWPSELPRQRREFAPTKGARNVTDTTREAIKWLIAAAVGLALSHYVVGPWIEARNAEEQAKACAKRNIQSGYAKINRPSECSK